MKKWIKFLIPLTVLLSTIVYAVSKSDIEKAKIESWISNSSTGSLNAPVSGPGSVPIGGMVAVMPNIQASDAWQPPASGVIKDGFMRADGHTITAQNVTDGSKLRAGTVLPSMTAKYPRGNTTSGTTGGANTYTPVGTNAVSNVPASGLSFSGSPATYSVSVPGHYHGMGTGANLSVDINHDHPNTAVSGAVVPYSGSTSAWVSGGGVVTFVGGGASGTIAVSGGLGTWGKEWTVTSNINHGHSWSGSVDLPALGVTAKTPTGSIGLVTGGSNGNAAFSASGTNTPSGSITGTATAAAQAFTGTQGNNEPAYVETVWVIRVK